MASTAQAPELQHKSQETSAESSSPSDAKDLDPWPDTSDEDNTVHPNQKSAIQPPLPPSRDLDSKPHSPNQGNKAKAPADVDVWPDTTDDEVEQDQELSEDKSESDPSSNAPEGDKMGGQTQETTGSTTGEEEEEEDGGIGDSKDKIIPSKSAQRSYTTQGDESDPRPESLSEADAEPTDATLRGEDHASRFRPPSVPQIVERLHAQSDKSSSISSITTKQDVDSSKASQHSGPSGNKASIKKSLSHRASTSSRLTVADAAQDSQQTTEDGQSRGSSHEKPGIQTTASSSMIGDANLVESLRTHKEHHSEVSDLVKSAIIGFADGITVPFALVAGLSALHNKRVNIMGGVAELLAGTISMSLGAMLAAFTERTRYDAERQREQREVREEPEAEEVEIYEILGRYGISNLASKAVVESLKSNEDM